MGGVATLHLSGDGFQPGATVRVKGPGVNKELPLTVADAANATVTGLDLSGAGTGPGEMRVVNPGRLVSNAMSISFSNQVLIRGVTPGMKRQDEAGPITLTLTGVGFVSGATATMTPPGGSAQALDVTPVDEATLTVNGFAGTGGVVAIDPSKLPVGIYDIAVTNPGAAAAVHAKFSVVEGAPVLSAITPTCQGVGTTDLNGSVTGSYLYPSSVVQATGGTLVNSPLQTACLSGTDALGACANGQLRVTSSLVGIPAGSSFTVTVVNPGPLQSGSMTFTVQNSCP